MRSAGKSNLVKLGVLALGALAAVQTAHAQDTGNGMQKAVETRQALFKVINYNSEQFFLMMKNKAPFDAAVVQRSAGRIEALAPMIAETFAIDTRKATGVKTMAREGIWTSSADFKAKSDDLAKAAAALGAAAKTGDRGATMKAAGAVGKACSACHDNYKDK
jgi:cytochrome c556